MNVDILRDTSYFDEEMPGVLGLGCLVRGVGVGAVGALSFLPLPT